MRGATQRVEWPTLVALAGSYLAWGLGISVLAELWLPLGMVTVALAAVLHASLTHEMLHGHPFRNRHLNAALVFPALSLAVPYMRFRDTHLDHHRDSNLTDPYDDPESNFFDPAIWHRLPAPMQWLLRVNNTLAGRLVIGPVLGQVLFMLCDLRLILRGDLRVAIGWLWHIPAVALVIWAYGMWGQMPVWAFALATYAALAILKIRTFLEHRAHDLSRARTVVIEDRGLLAFLFLNNNFHVVHHMHPGTPWYALPGLYARNKSRYLDRNHGYRYRTYREIFGRYFWRAKDPVPHPLWPDH